MVKKRTVKRMFLWGAITVVAIILLLFFVYRPWALNWGATVEEIRRPLPGDDIVGNPDFIATRAVSVRASAAEIWPWIIQIGYRRAGFYSYDRLDNDGIPSSEKIIPRYQNLKVGDLIPLSAKANARVAILEPGRFMLLVFENNGARPDSTWAWSLDQRDDKTTRLITRLRVRTSHIFSRILLDLFEIVMMRKCMLGIKRRAEQPAVVSNK